MADAREPYLVQVNSIDVNNDGTVVITKEWLNIYYITRVSEAMKDKHKRLYKAGARWYVTLTSGIAIWVDDDDCEKVITNINGSY